MPGYCTLFEQENKIPGCADENITSLADVINLKSALNNIALRTMDQIW